MVATGRLRKSLASLTVTMGGVRLTSSTVPRSAVTVTSVVNARTSSSTRSGSRFRALTSKVTLRSWNDGAITSTR